MNTCVDAADLMKEPDEPLARATAEGVELAAYPYPGGFNPYAIAWERLNDPMKVVRWVRHLTGKVWFTADMCADFIDTVADHWGWRGGAL